MKKHSLHLNKMNPEDKPRLLWSDEEGDVRKKKTAPTLTPVNEGQIELKLRRLTTGKGRPVIEVSNLPANPEWCQNLAKEIKNHLACGGTYKNNLIELHGEQFEKLTLWLTKKSLKWKKIGG